MSETQYLKLSGLGLVCLAAAAMNALLPGAAHATVPYLLAAAAVSGLTALGMRLEDRARAEEMAARAAPPRTAGSIFDEQPLEGGAGPERRSAEIYTRFMAFAAAPIVMAVQAAGAWWLARAFVLEPGWAAGGKGLFLPAALAAEAFVLFVFGRVLGARAAMEDGARFSAPAQQAGLAFRACLLAAALGAAAMAGWGAGALFGAWAMAAGLGLLAAESALFALGAAFLPGRRSGAAAFRPSVLCAMLSRPFGWARNLGEALDYQFGFDVSRTAAFRTAARAAVPFLAAQCVLLYALSALAFVGIQETGLVERFGRPDRTLDSGLHLKWPWPFETLRLVNVHLVRTIHVGFDAETNGPSPRLLLWTEPHYASEELFLVAGAASSAAGPVPDERGRETPANLMVINIPIEFQVTNASAFAYAHADPVRMLRLLATRALSRTAAGRELFEFFGRGQLETAASLRGDIQAEADRAGLGVAIRFVGMHGVHPPVVVAGAFQALVGAAETREARVLSAMAYAGREVPAASARADASIEAAEAYSARRKLVSAAEADRFLKRLEGWRVSPDVFRSRVYLRALADSLAGVRKYIVCGGRGREVVILNLEDRLDSDLFDLGAYTGRVEQVRPSPEP